MSLHQAPYSWSLSWFLYHYTTRQFFKSCNHALKLPCFSLSTMCGTGSLSSRCEELLCKRSARETWHLIFMQTFSSWTWHSYHPHLLSHKLCYCTITLSSCGIYDYVMVLIWKLAWDMPMSITLLQRVSRNFWRTGSKVCSEFPKFATNLAISLRSCQSNHELRNEVVNFTPNFVGKLRSSSLAKFASFDVVGLVI